MKLSLIIALAASMGLAHAAQLPPLPAGIAVKQNVEYVPGGGPRQMLDVYFPEKAEKPVPLVVWIHGGAWLEGGKDQPPALPLLQQGFAVASITYRFSQNATFPAQIEDCKSAIRWLRKNAVSLHIAPDRIGVWGASAGGHLVAMLGVSGDVKAWDKGDNLDQSSRVQAVCDWFGPTDFLTFGTQGDKDRFHNPHAFPAANTAGSPLAKLIGGAIPENQEKARAASPVTHVTKDAAPFLIMHGDEDPLVPYAQSTELQQALEKAGVSSKLVKLPGAGHGGPQFNERQTLQQVAEFFGRTLRN
jgi:acetyl esterase/lipase